MPNFSQRSYQSELLDEPGIPFADIQRNMQELNRINTLLGGHRITIKGLEILLRDRPKTTMYHVLEIGCGDGNNLRVLKKWAAKNGYRLQLHGVDYNAACIEYARQIKENEGIFFTCADYREYEMRPRPQVIFSSLFCHHFTDEQLKEQLRWMSTRASIGFFINDLHRHRFAYYSISLLTRLFSKSYLVKNDAPLSVLRGFRKREWQQILEQAGIANAACQWKWAFRWLITCCN